jgi:hypothetical protein
VEDYQENVVQAKCFQKGVEDEEKNLSSGSEFSLNREWREEKSEFY